MLVMVMSRKRAGGDLGQRENGEKTGHSRRAVKHRQPGSARASQGRPGPARASQGQPGPARPNHASQNKPGPARTSQGQLGPPASQGQPARTSQAQPGPARPSQGCQAHPSRNRTCHFAGAAILHRLLQTNHKTTSRLISIWPAASCRATEFVRFPADQP